MQVKQLLHMKHTTVTPETHLDRVWKLLERRDISLVPVVDKKNILAGAIGEDDLLHLLIPDYYEYFSMFFPEIPNENDLEDSLAKEVSMVAKDVMESRVVVAFPEESIYTALARMMVHRVRQLPVVEEDMRFLGMIIENEIMRYLFQKQSHLVKRRRSKLQ